MVGRLNFVSDLHNFDNHENIKNSKRFYQNYVCRSQQKSIYIYTDIDMHILKMNSNE